MADLKKRLFPAELAWVVINSLDKFNDKHNLIFILNNKFKELKDHTIFGKFTDIYNEAVNYYTVHNTFPDITYLNKKLPEGKLIKVLKNEEFSMTLYEDLLKTLEYEIIIKKFNTSLGMSDEVNIPLCLELSRDLASFATKNADVIPKDTKDSWLNSYDDYVKEYRGIETHMKALDDVIGVLSHSSMSTLAGPSGHGKSTFAISLAYYASTLGGMVVDYVSFEVPKKHILFNLASIKSSFDNNPSRRLVSSKIKEGKLSDEEKSIYKEHLSNLMDDLSHSKGFINIIDQTEIQYETFEQLCASLESIAEQRGRKADLIIIDNVDNLQVMKSSERDETTKVNQYIIALDKYCKTYCNGAGTHIMLLSQVNRTALKKLLCMENNGNKEVQIDVTCVQKFNALYEKPTTVLVEYSSPEMRVNNEMRIMPVKLRNRPLPLKPVSLTVEFEYSKVSGGFIREIPTDDAFMSGNLEEEIEMEDLDLD